jgi:hypothetical protein
MKKAVLVVVMLCLSMICFAQSNLLSFEDIKYLLHNDLDRADTFLVAKGYRVKSRNIKKKYNEYTMPIKGGTFVNVNLRADGKRMFIDLETTELGQYDLIYNSLMQFPNKSSVIAGDIQTYAIKGVCTVYITINDVVPYNPLRKDYDIQIVADKNVTADADLN